MSCLGVTGTTPARLVKPNVGLIPTTEFEMDGHKMDPSVSVPSETDARLAATDTADPLLDPHGLADATYGFCIKSIKVQICQSSETQNIPL